jgi:hypothetical protein
MRPWYLTLVLLACRTSSPEGATAMPPTEPRRIELTQDQVVSLGKGVRATLKTVLYTHATDKTGRSVNDALMQLEVEHGGKTEPITLNRLFPDGPKFTAVAGLELAIDFVDAYHQPATGAVLVKP